MKEDLIKIIALISGIITIYVFLTGNFTLDSIIKSDKKNNIEPKIENTKIEQYSENNTQTTINNNNDINNESDINNVNNNYFIDKRDGKKYTTYKFGTQIWFTKNLNFENLGVCYEHKKDNCYKYGRLYSFKEAVDACPIGWHIPSDDEWNILIKYFENKKINIINSEWVSNKSKYGISVIFGGREEYIEKFVYKGIFKRELKYEITSDEFKDINHIGYWHSYLHYAQIEYDKKKLFINNSYKGIDVHYRLSLRCIRNKKESLKYVKGYFVDRRDNKRYKWIKIGINKWMVDKLKYNSKKGKYTWNEALSSCPPGWHLPNDDEWNELNNNLNKNNIFLINSGWIEKKDKYRNNGTYWSSTKENKYISYWDTYYKGVKLHQSSTSDENRLFSVKCIKD